MREYTILVDLKNPGQFFACCGILYCADRMYDEVEGYFDDDKFIITAKCDVNPIDGITKKLRTHQIESIIHADTDKPDSPVYINSIPIRFDFYNHFDNRHKIKLFAGQEVFKKIISRWIKHLRDNPPKSTTTLQELVTVDVPSGLDTYTSWNALDVGFSLNDQKMKRRAYPLVEFFAHVGIQTYAWSKDGQKYTYKAWNVPLPITIARAVAAGAITLQQTKCFQFETEKSGQKQIFNTAREV